MNSRQRLIMTLKHKEPDKVPIDLGGTQTGITVGAYNDLKRYLGIVEENEIIDLMQQLVRPSERLLKKFKVDTRYIFPKKPKNWELRIKEDDYSYSFVDEWGITFKMPKKKGYYYDMVEHPLRDATIKDLKKYDWPDPRDPGRTEGLEKEAKNLYEHTDYAIVTGIAGSMFELAWYLRGFERFFMDMIENRKFAEALLDKLLEIWLDFFDEFLGVVGKYVQVVTVGDDLAMQEGPLMSLDLYRSVVKSRQKELFSFIKKHTDAYLFYHGCGSVSQFIPELIEVGVDILNPIQVSAKDMDTHRLKKEFGSEITFWGGGCDTQRVLPFGTPEEVKEEVKRRIKDLAPGGGFVFNQVHNIQPGVPPKNIVAMFEAANEYGGYEIEKELL